MSTFRSGTAAESPPHGGFKIKSRTDSGFQVESHRPRHIVDCEDMRMVERGRHLRLPLKTSSAGGVGQIVGKKLNRYRPVEPGIASAVDYAHATLTDRGFDAVWA